MANTLQSNADYPIRKKDRHMSKHSPQPDDLADNDNWIWLCDELLRRTGGRGMTHPSAYGIHTRGVIHVGAHRAEEYSRYCAWGATRQLWIEAQTHLCEYMRVKLAGDTTCEVVQACVSDRDGAQVDFMLASNVCSSSMLDMREHRAEYPAITEVGRMRMTTTTLDTILARDQHRDEYNVLSMDIQGAELLACMGMTRLAQIDIAYMEVNHVEMYTGCALEPQLTAFLEAQGLHKAEHRQTGRGWGDAVYVRRAGA